MVIANYIVVNAVIGKEKEKMEDFIENIVLNSVLKL